MTVQDDDKTTVRLSVPDTRAEEQDSDEPAEILLTLNRALRGGETLSVPLQFTGGVMGTDFTLTLPSGQTGVGLAGRTVTFTGRAAGSSTTARVELLASGDADVDDKTVTVNIPTETGDGKLVASAGLHGGASGSRTGNGQITLEDDDLPEVTITTTQSAAVTEGTVVSYTVTATPAPAAGLTVTVDVDDAPNADFVAAGEEDDQTVTIPSGSSSATDTVPTSADSTDEPSGPVTVTIASKPLLYTIGSASSITVTVQDNDKTTVTLTVPDAHTMEEDPAEPAEILLTLNRPLRAGETLSVPLQFADGVRGTDFTLALPSNQTGVGLSGSTVTFTGSGAGSSATARIRLLASGDADVDDKTVTVNIPTETGDGKLVASAGLHGGASGSRTGNGQITLEDDDLPEVTITTTQSAAVTEGTVVSYTVTATPAPAAGLTVTVDVDDAPNADFVAAGEEDDQTVTIPSGSSSATDTVPTSADSTDEPSGPVTVTIASKPLLYTIGSASSITVTVRDDDKTTVTLTVPDDSTTEEDPDETAEILLTLNRALRAGETLSAPLQFTNGVRGTDFTLTLPSGQTGVSLTGSTVKFTGSAGGSSATARVELLESSDDDAWDESTSVTIPTTVSGGLVASAGLHGGVTGSNPAEKDEQTITITDDDEPGIVFTPSSLTVNEGAGRRTLKRYRVQLATRPTHDVRLTVSGVTGTDLTVNPVQLDFIASGWHTGLNVWAWAGEDDDATDDTVTLTYEVVSSDSQYHGVTGSITVRVLDNEDLRPVVTIAGGADVTEGTAASYTVTATPAPASNMTVKLAVEDSPNSDFVLATNEGMKNVVIPTTGSVSYTVTTETDSNDEPNGAVKVTIQPDDAVYRIGSDSSASVKVADNDPTTVTLTVPDGIAREGSATDRAQLRVVLNRGLFKGESLTIPLLFTGGSTEQDFGDFDLSLQGSPKGVTLLAEGAIIEGPSTGPSSSTVNWFLTARQDADRVTEVVGVRIPTSSSGSGETLVASNLGGGVTGSGSGTITLVEDDTGLAKLSEVKVQPDWALKPAAIPGGGKFRLLFKTSTRRAATSLDIADYNSFVRGRAANGHTAIRAHSAQFRAVGCTLAVNARTNTETSGAGVPIYWLNGPKVADSYSDFYDGSWDAVTVASSRTEAGSAADSRGPWTGCNHNGMASTQPLGNAPNVKRGGVGTLTNGPLSESDSPRGTANPLFALSPVFSVPVSNKPLVTITGGEDVTEGTAASFRVTATQMTTQTLAVQVKVKDAPSSDFVDSHDEGISTVTVDSSGSVPFTVDTEADGVDEPNGPVTVEIVPSADYTVGDPSSATVLVIDDDGTSAATFAADKSTPAESVGTHNVRVNFSPAPAAAITLSYTVSGTAIAGDDFTALPGSINVSADATHVNIPVIITDDTADEDDETVILTLTAGSGYTLGSTKVHTLTIQDDDTPAATFAAAASTPAESVGTHNVRVNFSPAPTVPITLTYTVSGTAVADEDYTTLPESINVLADATHVDIPVAITDDTDDDDNETVILTLTAADGAGYTLGAITVHTLTIQDDDGAPAATFADAASTPAESVGTHNVRVNFSPAPTVPITLTYTVSGTAVADEDYTTLPESINVLADATHVDIPVAITDDTDDDDNETVILTLTAAAEAGYTLGAITVHTLTIQDDDTPAATFAATTSTPDESVGTHNVRVNFSPAPGTAITLTYTVSGTAVADEDYTAIPESINVLADATHVDIPVAITNDTDDDDNETVILTLTAAAEAGYTLGAITIHTLTIQDDDDAPPVTTAAATFAAVASTPAESVGTHNVRVNFSPAPAAAITLTYTVDGTAIADEDYTTLPGSVSVSANATHVNIPVTITNDTDDENDETVILTLTAGSGYTLGTTRVHTLTIRDDDGAPAATFAAATSTPAESVGTHNVRVNFSPAPAAAITLTYTVDGTAIADEDYTALPGSVDVSADATHVDIPVAITNDTDDDDETVILTLTAGSGYTLGATTVHTLTIRDDDGAPTATFAAAASTPAESVETHNVRVNFSPAPARAITLTYTVDGTAIADEDFTALPGSVDVSADATHVDIPVAITNDTADEDDETVILTLTAADGAGYTLGSTTVHTLTIQDDDIPAATFAAARSTPAESAGTHNVRVNFSPAPGTAITLTYTVDGTAIADNDFTALPGSVNVPADATYVNIPVAITNDTDDEDDETVILTLTAAAEAGYTLGSTTVHTLTIRDNDGAPPPVTLAAATFADATSTPAESVGTYNVRVNFSPAPVTAITLTYTVGGTAIGNADFTGLPGSVNVPADATHVNIPVTITNDTEDEDDETVILRLTAGSGYTLGSTRVHTLTIRDDDGTPAATFASATSTPDESVGTHNVRVNFSPAPAAPITLTYTVGGTAIGNADFAGLPGSVNVPADATHVNIPVTITNDTEDEDDETVILTLTAVDEAGYTLAPPTVHTLTIQDDDTAGILPSQTTLYLSEAGDVDTFTIRLESQPMSPVNIIITNTSPDVATVTPTTLTFTTMNWQTDQPVMVTAKADGVIRLTLDAQSADPAYTRVTRQSATVRVGEDPTATMAPWLVRFGRTVTGQAVTGVTARLTAPRTPGLTGSIAGQPLAALLNPAAAQSAGPEPPTALTTPQDARLNPGQAVSFRDLLAGSAFTLTSAPTDSGASYALWGQGAWSQFAGQADTQALDGKVISGTIGADRAQGPWLLGVAVSHTRSEGTSTDARLPEQDLEATMTLVTPYLSVDLTDKITLWSTLGYGLGTLTLTPQDAAPVETDTALILATAGLRGTLLEPVPTGGLALAMRSEARFLRTTAEADDTQGLTQSEDDVTLFRAGLEGSWVMPLANGGSVVPRLDVGFRQDTGDAETGTGMEVSGGLRWHAPAQGLTLDVAGQTLVTHAEEDFETWGAAAMLQWDPSPTTLTGPTLALHQTYGGPASGGNPAFWTEDPLSTSAGSAPAPADLRLGAEFAWGLALGKGTRVVIPTLSYGWSPANRDLAVGWRLPSLSPRAMNMELTVTHREAVRTPDVQGVSLTLTRTW